MKVAIYAVVISGLLCISCDAKVPKRPPLSGLRPVVAVDAGQPDASNARSIAGSGGAGRGAGVAGSGPSRPVGPPAVSQPPDFSMCSLCAPGCENCGNGCQCDGAPRPPQPWTVPFTPQGADGFRESDDVFCPVSLAPIALDVWSDGRGVFALVSGSTEFVTDTGAALGESAGEDAGVVAYPQASASGQPLLDPSAITQIWFNDGTGWSLSLTAFNDIARYALRGAPGAWVAMHDRGFPDAAISGAPMTSCSVGVLANGALDCLDLGPVADMSVVNSGLAHAVVDGTRLISYDGERWRGIADLLPFSASALWADADGVVAAGRIGTVMWLDEGSWTIQDPGTIEHFTRLWGPSRDDLWAGTAQGGIFHYDGMTWTEIGHLSGTTCDVKSPITGIWGAGGQVYFTTDTQFARWTGSGIETIGNWACSPFFSGAQITGVWGNAPDELFIALIDHSLFGSDRCAPVFIVYYDGTSYHRM